MAGSTRERLTEQPTSQEMGLEISPDNFVTPSASTPTQTATSDTSTSPASAETTATATNVSSTGNPLVDIPEDGEHLTIEEIERLKAAKQNGTKIIESETSTYNPTTTIDLGVPKSGEMGLELSLVTTSTTPASARTAETEGVGLEISGHTPAPPANTGEQSSTATPESSSTTEADSTENLTTERTTTEATATTASSTTAESTAKAAVTTVETTVTTAETTTNASPSSSSTQSVPESTLVSQVETSPTIETVTLTTTEASVTESSTLKITTESSPSTTEKAVVDVDVTTEAIATSPHSSVSTGSESTLVTQAETSPTTASASETSVTEAITTDTSTTSVPSTTEESSVEVVVTAKSTKKPTTANAETEITPVATTSEGAVEPVTPTGSTLLGTTATTPANIPEKEEPETSSPVPTTPGEGLELVAEPEPSKSHERIPDSGERGLEIGQPDISIPPQSTSASTSEPTTEASPSTSEISTTTSVPSTSARTIFELEMSTASTEAPTETEATPVDITTESAPTTTNELLFESTTASRNPSTDAAQTLATTASSEGETTAGKTEPTTPGVGLELVGETEPRGTTPTPSSTTAASEEKSEPTEGLSSAESTLILTTIAVETTQEITTHESVTEPSSTETPTTAASTTQQTSSLSTKTTTESVTVSSAEPSTELVSASTASTSAVTQETTSKTTIEESSTPQVVSEASIATKTIISLTPTSAPATTAASSSEITKTVDTTSAGSTVTDNAETSTSSVVTTTAAVTNAITTEQTTVSTPPLSVQKSTASTIETPTNSTTSILPSTAQVTTEESIATTTKATTTSSSSSTQAAKTTSLENSSTTEVTTPTITESLVTKPVSTAPTTTVSPSTTENASSEFVVTKEATATSALPSSTTQSVSETTTASQTEISSVTETVTPTTTETLVTEAISTETTTTAASSTTENTSAKVVATTEANIKSTTETVQPESSSVGSSDEHSTATPESSATTEADSTENLTTETTTTEATATTASSTTAESTAKAAVTTVETTVTTAETTTNASPSSSSTQSVPESTLVSQVETSPTIETVTLTTTESLTAASTTIQLSLPSSSSASTPTSSSITAPIMVDEEKPEQTETKFEAIRTTTQTATVPPLTATTFSVSSVRCISSDDCGTDAYCERRSGACRCKPGFQGQPPHTPCSDVNECVEELDDCDVSSRCVNYVGGYECLCAIGYRKTSEGVCEEIDECKESNGTLCAPNAICRNLPGAYLCECQPGFTGDGYTCIGIEKRHCSPIEWAKSDCGRNHICLVNSTGSIDCDTCKAGFTMKHGICSDIDECQSQPGPCHPDALCQNIMGAYLCQCQPGYAGDGHRCEDINECLTNSPCHPQATCINAPGAFSCQCPEGWTGDGVTACLNPLDNGCTQREQLCSNNGNHSACLSVQIGDEWKTACECQGNFRYNKVTGVCEDVNECLEDRSNCDKATTVCVNRLGGYTCVCAPGYEGRNGVCVDIDECDRGTAGCHVNAQCINRIGGVDCRCAVGFTGNGNNCAPINERPNTGGDCSIEWANMCRAVNKTCHIDDEEVPQCGSCMFGFQPMDGKCQPINAVGNCADPAKNDCDKNAECIDVRPGRHFCTCKVGYIGDGMHCDDVDECSIPRICDIHATCKNTNGSYECHCREGFTGNGFKCVPANQSQNCRINPQICHTHAGCQPDGTCKCMRGFEGDGIKSCQVAAAGTATTSSAFSHTSTLSPLDLSPPESSTSDGRRCSDHDRTACHVLATCDLDQGECICRQGFMGDGYITCTRVWEDCTTDQSMCHANATCDGESKQCQCNQGYMGDGISCMPDKLDCVVRANLCSEHATCLGRRCSCNPGYTGDGSTCIPVELPNPGNCSTCHSQASCVSNSCQCNNGCFGNGWICILDPNDCINYPGLCHMNGMCNKETRRCVCKKGFSGDGIDCAKRISCNTDPNVCHPEAQCLPDGRCQCAEGLLGDGVECHKAITAAEIFGTSSPQLVHFECPEDCGARAECVNGACKCLNGFTANESAECVDVDECTMGMTTCHSTATCINTEGSYECRCPAGSVGDGRACQQVVQNAPNGYDGIDVECTDDGMQVLLKEETKAFKGRIFVRGQSENPHCTKTFDPKSDETLPLSFHISFLHCDVQLEENDTLAATVIVQKHPMFVTEQAYSYRIRCAYPTALRTVRAHYNVSEITTAETINNRGVAPFCQLTVTNEENATIDSATVGQVLKLALALVPNETYSIFPRNCFAINLETSQRYALTDEAGCAFDLLLFPEWTRITSSLHHATFRTFKWPDSSMIRFECDCVACVAECPKVDCGKRRDAMQKKARMRFARDQSAITEEIVSEDDELAKEVLWLKNLLPPSSSTFSSVVTVNDDAEEQMAQKQMEEWLSRGSSDVSDFFTSLDTERICIGTPWLMLCGFSVLFAASLLLTMAKMYMRSARRLKQSRCAPPSAVNSDANSAYIKF